MEVTTEAMVAAVKTDTKQCYDSKHHRVTRMASLPCDAASCTAQYIGIGHYRLILEDTGAC